MNYSRVKKNYDSGLWNIHMVADALTKKVITEDEFKKITGISYEDYEKYIKEVTDDGNTNA